LADRESSSASRCQRHEYGELPAADSNFGSSIRVIWRENYIRQVRLQMLFLVAP
jgi:hypothetical protein